MHSPSSIQAAYTKMKKQIPLRLSQELYEALAAWAEDDFRSLNGQIEYLLTDAVRKRRRIIIKDE